MCEGADQEFFELIGFVPCGERGAESTFVSGEAAFGLGAMTVLSIGKAVVHHPPITPLGRACRIPRVERDDRAANPEFLAAERMIVLRVVALVAQQASRLQVRGRLPDRGGEVGRILTGTTRRETRP